MNNSQYLLPCAVNLDVMFHYRRAYDMSLPVDETLDTRVCSRLANRVAHRKPTVSVPTISVMHHSSTGMAEPSLATPKRAHRLRQDPTLLTTTPAKPVRKGPGGSRFLESICEQGSVPTGKRKVGQTSAIEHDKAGRKEYNLDDNRARKSSEAINEDQLVIRRLLELKLLEPSRSGMGGPRYLQEAKDAGQEKRRSTCRQS